MERNKTPKMPEKTRADYSKKADEKKFKIATLEEAILKSTLAKEKNDADLLNCISSGDEPKYKELLAKKNDLESTISFLQKQKELEMKKPILEHTDCISLQRELLDYANSLYESLADEYIEKIAPLVDKAAEIKACITEAVAFSNTIGKDNGGKSDYLLPDSKGVFQIITKAKYNINRLNELKGDTRYGI